MAPQPPAAPSAPALKLEGLNRTPIGAAAVPFPTSILTAKFRRGRPALATTGSSQDNSRLLRFLNGSCLFSDRSITYTDRDSDRKLTRLRAFSYRRDRELDHL